MSQRKKKKRLKMNGLKTLSIIHVSRYTRISTEVQGISHLLHVSTADLHYILFSKHIKMHCKHSATNTYAARRL